MKTEKLTYKEATQALIDGHCVQGEGAAIYKLQPNGKLAFFAIDKSWSGSCIGVSNLMDYSIVPDPSVEPVVETPDSMFERVHDLVCDDTVGIVLYKVLREMGQEIDKLNKGNK